MWPAMPPTIAPLMHPFASAAAGTNAMPRMTVAKISGFMGGSPKRTVAATIRWCGDWFPGDHRESAAARHRNPEQKCDEETRERCLPGDRTDDRKRSARLPRACDGCAQLLDGGSQARGDLGERTRHVGRGIDGAFRHTGLKRWFGCLEIHGFHASNLKRQHDGPPPLAICDRRRVGRRVATRPNNAASGILF